MNKPTPETYFTEIARKVFDDYFAHLGAYFVEESSSSISLSPSHSASEPNKYILGDRNKHYFIRYDGPTWFVEVLYLPSDGPRYSPRVVIGPIPETWTDPRRNRVEVLHTIPEGHDLRRYLFEWEYSTAEELERSLTKVRDLILESFTRPFLEDQEQLISLVAKRARMLDEETQTQTRNHNESIFRRLAEIAFQRRDYAETARYLMKVDKERLTPAEIKKLAMSLSKIPKCGS